MSGAPLAHKKTNPNDTNIWSNRSDCSDRFVGDRTRKAVQRRAVSRRKNTREVQTKSSDLRIAIIRDPAALSRRAPGRWALTIEIAGRIIETIGKQQFTARATYGEKGTSGNQDRCNTQRSRITRVGNFHMQGLASRPSNRQASTWD